MLYRIYTSENGKRKAGVFLIAESVMKTMRWMHGDKIDVLWDAEQNEGQLIRVKPGVKAGWKLHGQGKTGTLRFSLIPQFKLPEVNMDVEFETGENIIMFKLRKQSGQLF